MINESRESVCQILNQKNFSKSNRTQQQKYMCITNWGRFVLQIWAALFYYKLGQTLLQIGAASLLQIGASVVTNCSSCYILGQPLLQNKAGITNWGNIYYKLGQVLKIRAIITNWGITNLNKARNITVYLISYLAVKYIIR